MQEKNFYFISDDYFIRFNDPYLMTNKGTSHKRPCFFAFKDNKYDEIMWLVPVSSEYQKYKNIEQHKIAKYGYCNNFEFGYLAGKQAVFLIQNMCPVTANYLKLYVDKNNNPIKTLSTTENNIITKSKQMLGQYNHGVKTIFPNVNKIYKQLEKEVLEDRYVNNLKQELSKNINEEYKEYCKQIISEAKLNEPDLQSDKKEELLKIVEEEKNNKKTELINIYTTAIKHEVSLYHEVNADNVIYFDQRDEAIFEQVKAFYDSQPQSKIDKILENINSLPKGLNPEGKLDILRNNGIKHSNEMEPEERKAAFEKEEVITPKFGGKDI